MKKLLQSTVLALMLMLCAGIVCTAQTKPEDVRAELDTCKVLFGECEYELQIVYGQLNEATVESLRQQLEHPKEVRKAKRREGWKRFKQGVLAGLIGAVVVIVVL